MKVNFMRNWYKDKLNIEDEVKREILDDNILEMLNETISHSKKSSFYKDHLRTVGKLDSIKDMENLPFITEEDISRQGNQMVCISQEHISKISTMKTSGTTGREKRIYFTDGDVDRTIDFFSMGLGQFIEEGGKTLILMPSRVRNSIGDLIDQAVARLGSKGIKYGLLDDYERVYSKIRESRYIVGMPLQVLAMGRYLKYQGYSFNMEGILLSADNAPEETFTELQSIFECPVYNHYGITEAGLGGAVDCTYHDGMHPRELDLYIEIVNTDNNEVLPDGEWGEMVLTTLNRKAMPMIRYKTGDYGRFIDGICKCGQPFKRLDFLKGRVEEIQDISLVELDKIMFRYKNLIDYKVIVDKIQGKIDIKILFLPKNIPEKLEIMDTIGLFLGDNDYKGYDCNIEIIESDKYIYLHKGKRKIDYKV